MSGANVNIQILLFLNIRKTYCINLASDLYIVVTLLYLSFTYDNCLEEVILRLKQVILPSCISIFILKKLYGIVKDDEISRGVLKR